jgi:hypothetical protein
MAVRTLKRQLAAAHNPTPPQSSTPTPFEKLPEEDLDDGAMSYQCDACGTRAAAYKSVRFEVAPNCLAICLKRFGLGRFSKINRRVAAGETLNLAPFMAEGAMDQVGWVFDGSRAGPVGWGFVFSRLHGSGCCSLPLSHPIHIAHPPLSPQGPLNYALYGVIVHLDHMNRWAPGGGVQNMTLSLPGPS